MSVALLAALAGCGGSRETTPSDPIRTAVTHALTSSDPDVCEQSFTDRFLHQNFREADTPPVEVCQFDDTLPGEPFARSVRFSSVDAHGEHAVAQIVITGGEADGSRIKLELNRYSGHWKLNRFAEIQIDRPRFDAAVRRDLVISGFRDDEADCAVHRLRRIFDTDQIERLTVEGRTQVFGAAEVTCFGRESLVEQLTIAIRKGAPKDAPDEIVDCVIGKLANATTTGQLRGLFAAPGRFTDYFERLSRAAARACAKESEAGLLPHPTPS
jgi:hypothetical protein